MGTELNLLSDYPLSLRDTKSRGLTKTQADRDIARRFGREFFDGDRRHGYGGYSYHPRFWQPVIPAFIKQYALGPQSHILDIGCAKGFLLYDFCQIIPGIKVCGVDVSEYAIENSQPSVRPFLSIADATNLPFSDGIFDLVLSINTLHNLDRDGVKRALTEIMRVARGQSFVTVDAYRTEDEKSRMEAWNLTAKTVLHVDAWVELFNEIGYTGDYYWFFP